MGGDGREDRGTAGRRGGRRHGQSNNLHASARAGAGGHEKSGLLIERRHGDALGLVGAGASTRLLSTGRVFVKGLGQVFLKADDFILRQREKKGAYLDVGQDRDHDDGFEEENCGKLGISEGYMRGQKGQNRS